MAKIASLIIHTYVRYGVFPLRGKLLNVRDASARQLAANAEVRTTKRR